MELKHLRKNKIVKISTEHIESELRKLEAREDKYNKTIEDNKYLHKLLFDRICESGEGASPWRGGLSSPIKFSEDKEDYLTAHNLIMGATQDLKKIQEKKNLIESELIDRTLTES